MTESFIFNFLLLICMPTFAKSHTNFYSNQICAVLNTNKNSTAQSFPMFDQDQYLNLKDDQPTGIQLWNATLLASVESGCNLKICSEAYLDGQCEFVTTGNHSVQHFSRSIQSIACKCEKSDICDTIHVRKSSCGRVYFEGGCRKRHALYMDLTTNLEFSEDFPEEYSTRAEAFRLRKGCTISVFPQQNFKGRKRTLMQETVEGFQGKIGSYMCACNDTMYTPRKILQNPNKELHNMHFYGTNTHNERMAASTSFRNKRSTQNAYILLLGTTGSGKSSTINLLFDNPNVTKVGDAASVTSSIHEFRIPVPIDNLGTSKSELRVIDTPGLGDTSGLEKDARFLATLDNYLATHEELKDRIPNVVLIFHKFTDNRFKGKSAVFVRMIRAFQSFRGRITDEKFSNVVFVFSHFMSAGRTDRRRPDKRLSGFKQAIQNYTLFPLPTHMVLAENKAQQEQLPKVDGFFKLPNNDYYPRNLLEKLNLITENCGDPIGSNVFQTAFKNSENFIVSRIDYPLLSSSNILVQKYHELLTNGILNVEDTEVSQRLQNVWDTKLDKQLKHKYPMSLAYLQKALNLRGIHKMADVPETNSKIVEILAGLKLDQAVSALLLKGVDIQAPAFLQNQVVGYGYNVVLDQPLSTSPFVLGQLQNSNIGFRFPSLFTATPEIGSVEHFHIFKDITECLLHRLKKLGITPAMSQNKLSDCNRAGYNERNLSFRNNSCSLTAIQDFRVFRLGLRHEYKLSPKFETRVKQLKPVNTSDSANVNNWIEFFNTYGTHVVKSAYGGGSIQVNLESNTNPCNSTLVELTRFIYNLTRYFDGNGNETGDLDNDAVDEDNTMLTTTFSGGNSEYFSSNLWKMPRHNAIKLLSNWKQSLNANPVILRTEMELVPISIIVQKFGQNYTKEIEKATNLLLSGNLVYTQNHIMASKEQVLNLRRNVVVLEAVVKMMQTQLQEYFERQVQQTKIDGKHAVEKLKLESELLAMQTEIGRLKSECIKDKLACFEKTNKDLETCDSEKTKMEGDLRKEKIEKLMYMVAIQMLESNN